MPGTLPPYGCNPHGLATYVLTTIEMGVKVNLNRFRGLPQVAIGLISDKKWLIEGLMAGKPRCDGFVIRTDGRHDSWLARTKYPGSVDGTGARPG